MIGGFRRARLLPSSSRIAAALAAAAVLVPVVGSAPASAVGTSGERPVTSSQSSWTSVQELDTRRLGLDDSVVTRAGTSVVVWSLDDGTSGRVFTSVLRSGEDTWSPGQQFGDGRFVRCSPRGAYQIKECAQLVTVGADDVLLFAARETADGSPEHVLSVQRLAGHDWTSLDDIEVPAPVQFVRAAANDHGAFAVLWLDDPTTLGGLVAAANGSRAPLPALTLPAGSQALNHVQLGNDGAITAVVHTVGPDDGAVSYQVATLRGNSWRLDALRPTDTWRASPPIVSSAPDGTLVVAWAQGPPAPSSEQLVSQVRPPGATEFGPMTRLSKKWPCGLTYTYCATFGILDSGAITALWYDNWARPKPYGATYDPASGAWSSRTHLGKGSLDPFFDVHPDGTAVMSDGSSVWTCTAALSCTQVGAPKFTGKRKGDVFSEYRAGPAGSAVGFGYVTQCGEGFCADRRLQAASLG
jgi:hypothetical protein